jgi:DNA polymerase-3 subunit epsilon
MKTTPIKLNIKIEKPIVFFDLETTGLDMQFDRIVQISAIKYYPNNKIELIEMKFNPVSVKISEEANKIHGFTNEILKNEPTFKSKANELYTNFFKDSDLSGYNILTFDIPFLIEEFKRSGIDYDPTKDKTKIIDVYKILSRLEPRDLSSTYKYYTGKDLNNAHDADADNFATIEIFKHQIEKYGFDDPINNADYHTKTDKDGNVMIDFSGLFLKTKENKYVYGKGKHKGEQISSDNMDYLIWVNGKSNFNENTKYVAGKLIEWLNRKI